MSYYSSFTSNGLMVDHDIVPYKNLRNAIVIRACNDYKNEKKKYNFYFIKSDECYNPVIFITFSL